MQKHILVFLVGASVAHGLRLVRPRQHDSDDDVDGLDIPTWMVAEQHHFIETFRNRWFFAAKAYYSVENRRICHLIFLQKNEHCTRLPSARWSLQLARKSCWSMKNLTNKILNFWEIILRYAWKSRICTLQNQFFSQKYQFDNCKNRLQSQNWKFSVGQFWILY